MTLEELKLEVFAKLARNPDKEDEINEIYQTAVDNTAELRSGTEGDSIKTELMECDYAMEKLSDISDY